MILTKPFSISKGFYFYKKLVTKTFEIFYFCLKLKQQTKNLTNEF